MNDFVRQCMFAMVGVAFCALACTQKSQMPSVAVQPQLNKAPQKSPALMADPSFENVNSMLLEAVSDGNLKGIEQAIKQGADVNGVDEFGFSILVNALAHYEIELVEYLIRHGAVTDAGAAFEGPPLRLAGTRSPDRQELLDEALLDAASSHDLNEVKRLLQEGANINAADEEGFTVLVTTLASYELEMVNYLLGQGATIASI